MKIVFLIIAHVGNGGQEYSYEFKNLDEVIHFFNPKNIEDILLDFYNEGNVAEFEVYFSIHRINLPYNENFRNAYSYLEGEDGLNSYGNSLIEERYYYFSPSEGGIIKSGISDDNIYL